MLAGGAKDTDHGRPGSCGDVHETGVVTDRGACMGEKVNGFIDAGTACQVNAISRCITGLDDLLCHFLIVFTTQQPDLPTRA